MKVFGAAKRADFKNKTQHSYRLAFVFFCFFLFGRAFSVQLSPWIRSVFSCFKGYKKTTCSFFPCRETA